MKLYQNAITRIPPQSMASGITTQSEAPDISLALKQHQQYIDTLKQLKISVSTLDAEEKYPDCHFVEDAAIIHHNVAIMTRPGALERRGEVTTLRPALEEVIEVRELGGDATAIVDGGDVLFMGDYVFIGISHRTNIAGAKELKARLHEIDPALEIHFIPFDGVLHFKSGFTALNNETLLGNPAIKLHNPLPAAKIVWLPKAESYAANTLVANGAALVFQECKVAQEEIKKVGLKPIPLDMSEFRKMDGSFTCLSLLW